MTAQTTYPYKIVICGIQEQTREIIEFLDKNDIYVTDIVTISEEVAKKNKCLDTWVSFEDIPNVDIYYADTYSLQSSQCRLFFREKKFKDKRLIFLVYESHKSIFLITITDKKMQQKVIDLIKSNLDLYKEELERILNNI